MRALQNVTWVVVCVVSLAFGSAEAATITNGSFELTGSGTGLPGENTIPGWTIGGGGIDLGSPFWAAQDGVQSIDLNRNAAGSISQNVSTTLGTTYQVSFYLAGNPQADPPVPGLKTLDAFADAALAGSFSFMNDSTTTVANMGWALESFIFAGTGALVELKFQSTTASSFGPALDNISITSISAVPIPAALPLFGGALGLMGLFGWRRKRMAAAA